MSDLTEKVIEFKAVLENSSNNLWGVHFVVPNEIAEQLIEGTSRRVVCALNGEVEYQCGLLPYAGGKCVITVNKKNRERLGLKIGSLLKVTLRRDTSQYGLPMPEELEEVFRQDAEGSKIFHALTAGKQRTLLYIIGSVKDSEKRIMRAIAVVEHLKANNGKINYKQLDQAIRRPLI